MAQKEAWDAIARMLVDAWDVDLQIYPQSNQNNPFNPSTQFKPLNIET